MFKPFLILNLITLKFYNMNKRIQKSQISIGLLMMFVIAMPALLFSSCKKKVPPVAYYTVTFNSQGGSAVNPITGIPIRRVKVRFRPPPSFTQTLPCMPNG